VSDSLHHSLSASAPALRRSDYFRTLAVEPWAAREVRVFGLAEWLVGRMSEIWQEAMAEVWRGRRGPVLASLGGIGAVIAAEAAVLLFIAWRAVNGHMDLAAMVTGILAAIALSGVGWVGSYDHLLREALTAVRALFELEQRVQARIPHGRRSAASEQRIAGEVHFENVTFTYPGSRAPVLDGLDLRIAAGSSLAIVGANGAGKTTLIKLLARLYEPESGRITIGGLDLSELEPDAWRRQMAVVFQDFIQYPLPLRDNIGSGNVEQALAQAGGRRLLEKLPRGLDTVLSREFEGGVDLSGGEWQKVALARALAALDQASMLVLDEPTASLDVRSERELFARIQDPARGKTTILISHRLSSVR
jgi:ATP-binding cassette subfamily B protein